MRRIVIPFDQTTEAASLISDARRLIGPGGEFILVRTTDQIPDDKQINAYDGRPADSELRGDVQALVTQLRDEAVTVRVLESQELLSGDIDSSMSAWGIDLIACPTREAVQGPKLAWQSPLRRALAHSCVPILLCGTNGNHDAAQLSPPRVLVPLDGSEVAETALPLAEELAKERHASLWLTQVVPLQAQSVSEEIRKSLEYLQALANHLDCDIRIKTLTGRSTTTMLIRTVMDVEVTDVVMASHGRTADPRFIVGSVAESLIQHLQCRIVVVPLRGAASMAPAMR